MIDLYCKNTIFLQYNWFIHLQIIDKMLYPEKKNVGLSCISWITEKRVSWPQNILFDSCVEP